MIRQEAAKINNTLRDYRSQLKVIKGRSKKVKDHTVELVGFQGLVKWDTMVEVQPPIGEVVIINGTHNIPVLISDRHWCWHTVIHHLEEFYPPHYHDFWEIYFVKSGILTEVETGVEYVVGEYVIYTIEQRHHPKNNYLNNCDIDVHWISPESAETADEAMSIVVEYYKNLFS